MIRFAGSPRRALLAACVTLAPLACADPPTTPALRRTAAPVAIAEARVADTRQVRMLDECDPTSFDAVLGPGACTRAGGLSFANFQATLARLGSVPGWRFAPSTLDLQLGQSFVAYNAGGETHTFTEVEHFGGGIVPALNAASGNPVPAPECLQLAAADFVAPGTSTAPDTPDEAGVEHYQCCIHPWMRADVRVR